MLLAVVLFSKENALAYFSTTDKRECDEFQLQTMAYSSMDVIDARENSTQNRSQQELFYGYLLSNNDYKSYGYVTNTRVKFILIFDALDSTVRDQDIRSYFKQLHLAYCNEVSNPFFYTGNGISTKRFNRFIGSLFT
ncbi:Trafficking protein particle complex subunit 2-like protein [Aphelenchoides bicaudatus]|nr:Trafficking protein particle complex subunit 2-like protein [Aphelenchoides bicaudatus]